MQVLLGGVGRPVGLKPPDGIFDVNPTPLEPLLGCFRLDPDGSHLAKYPCKPEVPG